ncbi:hypothetical protein F4774DRAFT_46009 [Daldinia eschscholtzii]|nr:hypothetical protein F4774DRAFT_46009 [Daldinia eschscholtzii]
MVFVVLVTFTWCWCIHTHSLDKMQKRIIFTVLTVWPKIHKRQRGDLSRFQFPRFSATYQSVSNIENILNTPPMYDFQAHWLTSDFARHISKFIISSTGVLQKNQAVLSHRCPAYNTKPRWIKTTNLYSI